MRFFTITDLKLLGKGRWVGSEYIPTKRPDDVSWCTWRGKEVKVVWPSPPAFLYADTDVVVERRADDGVPMEVQAAKESNESPAPGASEAAKSKIVSLKLSPKALQAFPHDATPKPAVIKDVASSTSAKTASNTTAAPSTPIPTTEMTSESKPGSTQDMKIAEQTDTSPVAEGLEAETSSPTTISSSSSTTALPSTQTPAANMKKAPKIKLRFTKKTTAAFPTTTTHHDESSSSKQKIDRRGGEIASILGKHDLGETEHDEGEGGAGSAAGKKVKVSEDVDLNGTDIPKFATPSKGESNDEINVTHQKPTTSIKATTTPTSNKRTRSSSIDDEAGPSTQKKGRFADEKAVITPSPTITVGGKVIDFHKAVHGTTKENVKTQGIKPQRCGSLTPRLDASSSDIPGVLGGNKIDRKVLATEGDFLDQMSYEPESKQFTFRMTTTGSASSSPSSPPSRARTTMVSVSDFGPNQGEDLSEFEEDDVEKLHEYRRMVTWYLFVARYYEAEARFDDGKKGVTEKQVEHLERRTHQAWKDYGLANDEAKSDARIRLWKKENDERNRVKREKAEERKKLAAEKKLAKDNEVAEKAEEGKEEKLAELQKAVDEKRGAAQNGGAKRKLDEDNETPPVVKKRCVGAKQPELRRIVLKKMFKQS